MIRECTPAGVPGITPNAAVWGAGDSGVGGVQPRVSLRSTREPFSRHASGVGKDFLHYRK